MEKVPRSYPMEPSMKENGKMANIMEKAPRSCSMEPSMKENGKMVR